MREITEKVVKAFVNGTKRSVGNTVTDGTTLKLHGNLIAERMPDGSIYATLAGHPTKTTRDRLNGLCAMLGKPRFYQSKWVQFYGDRAIGSNEIIVLIRPDGKPVSHSSAIGSR